MAISLDTQSTSTRPPVVAARALGAKVVGMVVDKEMRGRIDRDGNPILNARGKQSQEEVLTILVMEGTSGTISGGDLADDRTPDTGELCRVIFRGMGYGSLIEARKLVGPTQVGDVLTITAETATIWRGAGDIAAKAITDNDTIAKARAKGLSISWDLSIGYRRPNAKDTALVEKAEKAHMDMRANINLDNTTVTGDDEPW